MIGEFFEFTLRCAAAGILGLFALLLLRDRWREPQGWFGLAVVAGSFAFLITSSNVFYHEGIADTALRQLAALLPLALWAATVGVIQPQRDWPLLAAAIGYLAIGLLRASLEFNDALVGPLTIAHGVLALVFIVHAAYRASRSGDTWRLGFAFAAAVFGAVVVQVDPIAHKFDIPFAWELAASIATFLFAGVIAFCSLDLSSRRMLQTVVVSSPREINARSSNENTRDDARRRRRRAHA